MTASSSKVILLGIDHLDWHCLQIFVDKGLLPAFNRLLSQGAASRFLSATEQSSSTVWTSMMTGVDELMHGVLHDFEYGPGMLSAQSVTANCVRVPRVWDYVDNLGLACNVMGWPALQPANSQHGVTVANSVQYTNFGDFDIWPLSPDSVHPNSWRENVLDYRVFPQDISPHYTADLLKYLPPELQQEIQSSTRLLLSQLLSLHSIGMRLAEDTNHPWQFLALRFDTLYQVSELPLKINFAGHPLSYLLGWYQFMDAMLDKYLSYLGDNDYFMLVSNQGVNPHLIGRPAGLFDASLSGVLMMKGPGVAPDSLIESVTVLDIAPTLLAMLGLSPHAGLAGNVLFEPLQPMLKQSYQPFYWPQHEVKATELAPISANIDTQVQQLHAFGYALLDFSILENITNQVHAEQLFCLARALFVKGRLEECVEVLNLSLSMAPKHIPILILLFRCLLTLSRIDECRLLVQRYESLEIHPVWKLVANGMLAFGAYELQTAIEYFQQLSQMPESPINAPLWIADCLLKLGRYQEARTQLELATTLQIEQGIAWEMLARVYTQLQEYRLAMHAVNVAMTLQQPLNPHLFIVRFQIHAAAGDLAAAKSDLFRAIRMKPGIISEKEANKTLIAAMPKDSIANFEMVKF